MTMVKAIFFDIDDTLYSTSVFAEMARRSAVEAMIDVGVKTDPETLFHELQEVIQVFTADEPVNPALPEGSYNRYAAVIPGQARSFNIKVCYPVIICCEDSPVLPRGIL